MQIVGRFLHVDEASAAPQYSPGAVGAVLVGRARLAEPPTATLALRRWRRRASLQRASPLSVRTRAGVAILLLRLAVFADRGRAGPLGARHRAVDARAGVAPVGRWIRLARRALRRRTRPLRANPGSAGARAGVAVIPGGLRLAVRALGRRARLLGACPVAVRAGAGIAAVGRRSRLARRADGAGVGAATGILAGPAAARAEVRSPGTRCEKERHPHQRPKPLGRHAREFSRERTSALLPPFAAVHVAAGRHNVAQSTKRRSRLHSWGHRPTNFGARFSTKALAPSR